MDPKLHQLSQDGDFRSKIVAVMTIVAQHGTETYIVSGLRTPDEQAKKVAKGYSQTQKSYHLPHGSDRLSFAADIVPKQSGYQAPKWFWVLQAHVAVSYGLGVGILFGLHGGAHDALLRFLKHEDKSVPFDPHAWIGPLGWDSSHLQAVRNWD